MGNLTFRWSFGLNSYYWRAKNDNHASEDSTITLCGNYRDVWNGFKYPEYAFWLDLAIGSAQRLHPNNNYVLMYNGNDGDEGIEKVRNILSECSLVDENKVLIFKKQDYKSPFPFDPPASVWWKWIPLEFDLSEKEIVLDLDTIFIGNQTEIADWVSSDIQTMFCKEIDSQNFRMHLHFFKERNKECVNAGFLAMDKKSRFRKLFAMASRRVPYSPNCHWANFYAEQETLNVAHLMMIQSKDKLMKIISEDKYTWWDANKIGPKTEWCHFVAVERKLSFVAFYSLFRKIILLGKSFKENDKEILSFLTNETNPYRSVPTTIERLRSNRVKTLYHNIARLYNVKSQEFKPPTDTFSSEHETFIPESSCFVNSERNGTFVKSTFNDITGIYEIQGDLFGDLNVTHRSFGN